MDDIAGGSRSGKLFSLSGVMLRDSDDVREETMVLAQEVHHLLDRTPRVRRGAVELGRPPVSPRPVDTQRPIDTHRPIDTWSTSVLAWTTYCGLSTLDS